MPRGDGTGPMGTGAMTGHRGGFCSGFAAPGFVGRSGGRGSAAGFGRNAAAWGQGYGGGRRGWCTTAPAAFLQGRQGAVAGAGRWTAPNPEMEKAALKSQAEALQAELEFVKNRLENLETDKAAG